MQQEVLVRSTLRSNGEREPIRGSGGFAPSGGPGLNPPEAGAYFAGSMRVLHAILYLIPFQTV